MMNDIQTNFEKLRGYEKLKKEYEKLAKESDIREVQNMELMERYEDLVDDFVVFTQKGKIDDPVQKKKDEELAKNIREKHDPTKPRQPKEQKKAASPKKEEKKPAQPSNRSQKTLTSKASKSCSPILKPSRPRAISTSMNCHGAR